VSGGLSVSAGIALQTCDKEGIAKLILNGVIREVAGSHHRLAYLAHSARELTPRQALRL